MVNRIVPGLGPENYKTYALVRPKSTHMRKASCEEVNCPNYTNGWMTLADEATVEGQKIVSYIRNDRSRSHVESRHSDGRTVFTFKPGQQCFRPHELPADLEPLYVVKDGDYRGNPRHTQPRRHVRAEDWVEDFATHQQKIEEDRKRG